MLRHRSRILGFACFVALAAVSSTLGVGCHSEQDTRVVAPTVDVNRAVPGIDAQVDLSFFEDIWTTVYATPFVTTDTNCSWTYVNAEVDAVGTYGGVNSAQEAFTLDVSAVDYFDQKRLLELDDDGAIAAVIDQFDMTLSFVRARYTGPAGSVDVDGVVRSYDAAGQRNHFFQPIRRVEDDDALTIVLGDTSDAGYVVGLPVGLPLDLHLDRRTSDSGCDGSWKDCNKNSKRPSKPRFSCPSGKRMNASCERDCASAFNDSITSAIDEACTKLCERAKQWDEEKGSCNNGTAAGWIVTAGGILTVSTPGGFLAVLAADALLVYQHDACLDAARDRYRRNVDGVQSDYNDDVKEARNNYKNCAADCCEDDLISEEEGYELIGQ